MENNSISDFLEALAQEKTEKKMIKLISEGHMNEDLLERLLEKCGEKQK